jgi:hypothetical protein
MDQVERFFPQIYRVRACYRLMEAHEQTHHWRFQGMVREHLLNLVVINNVP